MAKRYKSKKVGRAIFATIIGFTLVIGGAIGAYAGIPEVREYVNNNWVIEQKYEITIDLQDGSEKTVYKVLENAIFPEPATPTREGFDFAGWDTDYVFGTPVKKDYLIKATWNETAAELQSYIIKIYYSELEVENIEVVEGSIFPEPATPTREGYTFIDWESEYDFESPITKDYTIHAKWQLPVPTAQIDLSAQALNITPVAGAVAYRVKLNGHDAFYVENTSVELASYNLPSGTVIQVWAVGDGQTYVDSEGVEIVVEYQQLSTPIISIEDGKLYIDNLDPNAKTVFVSIGGAFGVSAPVHDFPFDLMSWTSSLTPGEIYEVTVYYQPSGFFYESDVSNAVEFHFVAGQLQQLTAPIFTFESSIQTYTISYDLNSSFVPEDLFVSYRIEYSLDGENWSAFSNGGLNGNTSVSYKVYKYVGDDVTNIYLRAFFIGDNVVTANSDYSSPIYVDYCLTPIVSPTLTFDEDTQTFYWENDDNAYFNFFVFTHTGGYVAHFTIYDGSGMFSLSELSLSPGIYRFRVSSHVKTDVVGFSDAKNNTSDYITLQIS